MTEAEWSTSDEVDRLLSFAAGQSRAIKEMGGGRLTERKLRLLFVAYLLRHKPLLDELQLLELVEAVGRLADGDGSPEERAAIKARARTAAVGRTEMWREADSPPNIRHTVAGSLYPACESFGYLTSLRYAEWTRRRLLIPGINAAVILDNLAAAEAWAEEPTRTYQTPADRIVLNKRLRRANQAQAQLLRCVAGNPFRPVAADPRWLTSTAISLAETIYADRAFDRLPILADALEDAGCDHPDVLAHCRTHPEHARGCWVLDLVLRKF